MEEFNREQINGFYGDFTGALWFLGAVVALVLVGVIFQTDKRLKECEREIQEIRKVQDDTFRMQVETKQMYLEYLFDRRKKEVESNNK